MDFVKEPWQKAVYRERSRRVRTPPRFTKLEAKRRARKLREKGIHTKMKRRSKHKTFLGKSYKIRL